MTRFLPILLAGHWSRPPPPRQAQTPEQRVERVLAKTPVIDGHNDLPWEIRDKYDFWRKPLDLDADTSRLEARLQTDLPRMRRGGVGAQFWSVWIPARSQGRRGDPGRRSSRSTSSTGWSPAIPRDLEMASTAADIRRIHKAGRIASLIGIEGGHQIGNSPGGASPVLRARRPLHDPHPFEEQRLGGFGDRRSGP